jgi:anti-sigma B factor antagonist
MNEPRTKGKTFAPEGELTIYTAEVQKSLLLEAMHGQAAIVMDLSKVSELDSAGLQLLILAKLESERRQIPFEISGHSPAVLSVMDLCNLSRFFGDPVFIPSEQTAGSQNL